MRQKIISAEAFPRIGMNSVAENHLCRNIFSNKDARRSGKLRKQKKEKWKKKKEIRLRCRILNIYVTVCK